MGSGKKKGTTENKEVEKEGQLIRSSYSTTNVINKQEVSIRFMETSLILRHQAAAKYKKLSR